jgi:O-glycosyl hydrolase
LKTQRTDDVPNTEKTVRKEAYFKCFFAGCSQPYIDKCDSCANDSCYCLDHFSHYDHAGDNLILNDNQNTTLNPEKPAVNDPIKSVHRCFNTDCNNIQKKDAECKKCIIID